MMGMYFAALCKQFTESLQYTKRMALKCYAYGLKLRATRKRQIFHLTSAINYIPVRCILPEKLANHNFTFIVTFIPVPRSFSIIFISFQNFTSGSKEYIFDIFGRLNNKVFLPSKFQFNVSVVSVSAFPLRSIMAGKERLIMHKAIVHKICHHETTSKEQLIKA